MKNTIFFGLSLFCTSLVMGQNATSIPQKSQTASSVDLPYSYGFETEDLDEWFVTNEGAGNIWERMTATPSTPDPSEGTYYMIYQFHPTDPANTYLYSRGLNLKAGRNITLEFDYQGVDYWFPEKMEVKIGTEATVAAQTTQLWIDEEIGNYPYETATVNFTVPADGVYYLSFRAFSDPDQFYLALDNIKVYENVLATQNATKSTLKFYPNPVKDILTISDVKEISSYTIFDISGKKVLSNSAKSSKLELNVSQLKPGMYIVKANSDGVLKTFKFIKK